MHKKIVIINVLGSPNRVGTAYARRATQLRLHGSAQILVCRAGGCAEEALKRMHLVMKEGERNRPRATHFVPVVPGAADWTSQPTRGGGGPPTSKLKAGQENIFFLG